MSAPPPGRTPRVPSLLVSLVPVVVLVSLLALNVQVFGSADNQVVLVIASSVAALIAVGALGLPWKVVEDGIVRSITMAMPAVLILLTVGMLISAWIGAGVVPLLIVYGLELISPSVFLLTACLVCCVVSLASGSSWTTAGTVGVALMGIGQTIGVEAGLVAGAVVSGSYFGDKMSPLSDTTNLAPAMAGATLVEHVRHMVWTVTPALLVSLVLYGFLGGRHDAGPEALARVEGVVGVLRSEFTLSPFLLVPPALVLLLVARRFPAVPALLAGTFSAVVLGLAIQPLPAGGVLEALGGYFTMLYGGFALAIDPAAAAVAGDETRVAALETVRALLDGRGGMKSMLGTVALVVTALSFGGVMEVSGMLGSIAGSILKLVRSTGSLIAATILTCLGVNVLASDQYMAIVIPGRMFRTAFLERRLHPKNLSRALEDSGTVTSALIPWNTCGAQMAAVLGVATAAYAPYAFLNWLCPLVSIVYGFTGFTITKIGDAEAEERLAAR